MTPVACIVATSTVTMVYPGGKAKPTELVAALGAGHVHAALVLLNRPFALGAGLGVG